jgi:hypothetical protein
MNSVLPINPELPKTRHFELRTIKGTAYRLEVCYTIDGKEMTYGFWDRCSGSLTVHLRDAVYVSKNTLHRINRYLCSCTNGQLKGDGRAILLRDYNKSEKHLLEKLVQEKVIEPESRLVYIDPINGKLITSSSFDVNKGVKDLDKE